MLANSGNDGSGRDRKARRLVGLSDSGVAPEGSEPAPDLGGNREWDESTRYSFPRPHFTLEPEEGPRPRNPIVDIQGETSWRFRAEIGSKGETPQYGFAGRILAPTHAEACNLIRLTCEMNCLDVFGVTIEIIELEWELLCWYDKNA